MVANQIARSDGSQSESRMWRTFSYSIMYVEDMGWVSVIRTEGGVCLRVTYDSTSIPGIIHSEKYMVLDV
jgi:hypothetical protein